MRRLSDWKLLRICLIAQTLTCTFCALYLLPAGLESARVRAELARNLPTLSDVDAEPRLNAAQDELIRSVYQHIDIYTRRTIPATLVLTVFLAATGAAGTFLVSEKLRHPQNGQK